MIFIHFKRLFSFTENSFKNVVCIDDLTCFVAKKNKINEYQKNLKNGYISSNILLTVNNGCVKYVPKIREHSFSFYPLVKEVTSIVVVCLRMCYFAQDKMELD